MKTKNLTLLVASAVVLGGLAWGLVRGGRTSSPSLNGTKMVPEFSLEDIAKIDVGEGLSLAATDAGWVLSSHQNYPADPAKIAENLLALSELKVGQVVRGRTLQEPIRVVLRDTKGTELVDLTLGERHPRWGFGRYAEYQGQTVLVSEMLDAFDSDLLRWCEPTIVDSPRIRFHSLADSTLSDETLGFTNAITHAVTIAGDTNRIATIGGTLPGGSERYLRLDNTPWTFVVPAYAVEELLPKKEEPKEVESDVETNNVTVDDVPEAAATEPAP